MADWMPLSGGAALENCDRTATSSVGVSVNSAAANTKPTAWTQITASATYDWDGFDVVIKQSGTTQTKALADFAVGASGSEQLVVENLCFGSLSQPGTFGPYHFPVPVKAGTRVSCRFQTTSATQTMQFCVVGRLRQFRNADYFGRVTTYGADTATSGGVVVDSGASANTKGAWTEITASCTNPLRALLICLYNPDSTDATHVQHHADFGVGASGSEQLVVGDVPITFNQSYKRITPTCVGPLYVDLPAGTRLVMRDEADDATSTRRKIGVTLIGLD